MSAGPPKCFQDRPVVLLLKNLSSSPDYMCLEDLETKVYSYLTNSRQVQKDFPYGLAKAYRKL